MIKQLSVYITEKLQDYKININDILKIKNGGAQSSDFLKVNYHLTSNQSDRLFDIYSTDSIEVIDSDIVKKIISDEDYEKFNKNLDKYVNLIINSDFLKHIHNNNPNNPDVDPFKKGEEISEENQLLYDVLKKNIDIDKVSLVRIIENTENSFDFFIIVSYKENKNKYIENVQ